MSDYSDSPSARVSLASRIDAARADRDSRVDLHRVKPDGLPGFNISAPASAAANGPPAIAKTWLDWLVQVIRTVAIAVTFIAFFAIPDQGASDTPWILPALVALGSGFAVLWLTGRYQRSRSAVLDRPAWEQAGATPVARRFTRRQLETGRSELLDENDVVVASTDSRRKASPETKGLWVGDEQYRWAGTKSKSLVQVNTNRVVLTVGRKNRLVLAGGLTLSAKTTQAAAPDYRLMRLTTDRGEEVMVLRWTEHIRPSKGSLPLGEALVYRPAYLGADLIPVVLYAFGKFETPSNRR
jgi:hypothetical protein